MADIDRKRILDIIEKAVEKTLGETPTEVFFSVDKFQRSIEAVFRIKGQPHQLLLRIDQDGTPVMITIDSESYLL